MSDHALKNLIDEACSSARSLIRMESLLNEQYGRSLQDNERFRIVFRRMLNIFPELVDQFQPEIGKSDTFHQLQAAVRSGTASKLFPVGTLIPDVWTSPKTGETYHMPLIVVHYGKVRRASDGVCVPGAILLRQNSVPDSDSFAFHIPGEERKILAKVTYELSDLHYHLNSPHDYLTGCSSALRSVMTEIMLQHSVFLPGPARAREEREFEVYCFVPSLENLGCNPYRHPDFASVVWQYFRDTPEAFVARCPKRCFNYPLSLDGRDETAASCWLQSEFRDAINYAWIAGPDGLSHSVFTEKHTYAPAHVIA